MYYNTTHQTSDTLEKYRGQTWKQEELVLQLFRDNPTACFTPFEVLELLQLRDTPITSIRRAINDLIKVGQLEKTDTLKAERYGKPNYCWKLIN